MKSMGKMRSLAPQLESLKAQYKTDKVQLQKSYHAVVQRRIKLILPPLVFPSSYNCDLFSLYKLLLLDLAMRHSPGFGFGPT